MKTVPNLKPELRRYERYLRGYHLAYEHFEVLDIIPQDKTFAVTVMLDRRSDAFKPWCVQYRGNGHYFSTLAELDNYCRERGFKGWRYRADPGLK